MEGFFSTSKLIGSANSNTNQLPHCGSCGLYRDCISPKMKPSGEGRKKILIVAEAPGELEDIKGTQLIGKSGKLLKQLLKELDISLHKDCWKTNAIICRPKNNETPSNEKIRACSPNLFKTIKKLNPNVVILLGGVSVQSLIGTIRNETMSTRGIWMGWQIPLQKLNIWICPTYHPSYLLRTQDSVVELSMKSHLRAAIKKAKSKPWTDIPNYEKQIEIINRPSKAISFIRDITKKAGPFAFDYEANCLKPEYKGSEMYSCSICYKGKRTIAFPWADCVVEPMKALLSNKSKKIAANMKFEHRWTHNKLNTSVKNWFWDTMLAAHVLNNSKGVSGLKFQSFVVMGQSIYNEHIESLLKAEDKSHLNRIHEVDMNDLLLYNGLDSLLEYKLAEIQMKLLRTKL